MSSPHPVSSSLPQASQKKPTRPTPLSWGPFWVAVGLALVLTRGGPVFERRPISNLMPAWAYNPTPLVMGGGDPYIRALMRTISASEANGAKPYSLLYGGKHFSNLRQHPDQCMPITVGPNRGDCSTAAGRYQFLTSTWEEKAEQYHPQRSQLWLTGTYNFEPEYQDEVVYEWLTDTNAWGTDLSALLRQNRIDDVLARLSGTWTSLGYGLETNSVSSRLPKIYQRVLEEELAIANNSL
ncbi:MAG: glycoside hydrolase family protein [Elainellaceae cyanobacterium]